MINKNNIMMKEKKFNNLFCDSFLLFFILSFMGIHIFGYHQIEFNTKKLFNWTL